MNVVLDAIGAQAFQVAVVFAIVFALDVLVARRGSVGLRTALWAAFFVKLFLPPSVASPVSVARIFESAPETAGLAAESASGSTPSLAASVLVGVWIAGCVASLALALRRMQVSRTEWLDGARAAPEAAQDLLAQLSQRIGMKRAPPLFLSDDVAGAASVGLRAPVVVVPARLVASRLALEHVLLHELGHVRRRDGLRATLWTLARCVYWFHPLVHLAARRAALVRELACDELAVVSTSDGARGYRRTLLDIARPLVRATPALTGFAGMGSMITARIERLERVTPRLRRFDLLPACTFAFLCVCCIPLGARNVEPARLPTLDEVDGCMRKRILVMAEIARRQQVADSAASAHQHP